MDFDRLLRNYDSSAGGKEKVALAVFHLVEYEGYEGVSQADVRNVISQSRSTISPSGIGSYIRRLKNDNLLTEFGDNKYILSNEGEDEVLDRLDMELLVDYRDDLFIDTEVVDDYYYVRLIDNINKCYQARIYDATTVLTRKLFEHMTYKILMGHFGSNNVSMYFNEDSRRQIDFKQLRQNLKDNVTAFRQYCPDMDMDVAVILDEFREQGNAGAHSIRVDVSEEEIEELSSDATRLTEVLFETWEGVQLANGSQ